MTTQRALLAGGCFWGMQDLIRRFPGVLSTRVGYTGGDVPHATYRNHGTHAEAIEILFDPAQISFRQLLEFFFQIHDPTTKNRQGNDKGLSYRSAIFYTTDNQKRMALDTIADVNASGLWPAKVVTELAPAGPFWEAEPEHQDYLERIPDGYTCHFIRPDWKLPARGREGGGGKGPPMNCLVTGGGGFLGLAIVKALLAQGHCVRTYQRQRYASLDALGVQSIQGDLADAASLTAAARNINLLFHVAAKPGVWGSYASFHLPNVVGTQNVLDACRAAGVPRLIFTSSPSVVFSGTDENQITESTPYPKRFLAHYPKTKAIAEQLVLAANAPDLATIALRPHLIWGPGDPHLVPRILDRARTGRLKLVGTRSNLVDSTYIDNAAHAHLLAAAHLAPGAPCAGKAYFISNSEPLPMADLIQRILAAANLPTTVPSVNAHLAYAAGAALEFTHKLLGIQREPLLTRFVARQLSTAHWFDLTAARRHLHYHPLVSIDEGMIRLAQSLRDSA